ncbi:twin-arginine translocase subunit TatC [endosymbiont of unidentified scaly snail isolate Monju]|uniref:twin-arginine translocase subunit TatC n=1 Tax=endosymbiont of unidentified scaly snail isolate Monju TaxID=1248727 RepID=UPI0003891A4A|nr:twin-arginine translocase subunit TatC [endosymbiont of unidentified scaly snail isolate Monju]BAN68488.1 sec-independent protein translocase protein TatC [endosymbiont of unidentified scaly snail isolate Monju]
MSDTLPEQPFMAHLLELRDRLMRSLLAVLILLLALFPFGNDIYTFIADPLMRVLPEGTSMIATKVASPFLTPFKLSLVAAVFLGMPYLLYQLWSFIAPGLYQHEKRLALPLLASSIALFYLGAVFAYVVVFPLIFAFLTSTAPEGVLVMTDISEYLDFVLTLFFAFGLAFQVPVATILLVLAGMTTPDQLAGKRPYVVVGAFVIGMLLTPPDVISQTLLAVPMWMLFELGVFLSRLVVRGREEEKEDSIETEPAMAAAGGGMAASVADTADEEDAYRPLTDEEMEAELDAMEDEDDEDDEEPQENTDSSEPEPFVPDAVDEKLERMMRLREEERYAEARSLLYEVLAEGNELQVRVARNILEQLDS